MLSNPANGNLNIGAIGYTCGFSSESQFSKSFKNRYGMSPSEARAMGQAVVATAADPAAAGGETPEFTAWIRSLGR